MTNYNNQSEQENFLFGKDKKSPFAAPQAYFDQLPNRIINRIEVEQELQQYAALSGIAKQLQFAVPKNYFSKNENLLEYRYELATFNELSKVAKPVLKPLTENYLDSLSDKVLKRIELTDELKSYSTLAEIKKEKTFAVNPDYFETVADSVKERYHANKAEKISIFEKALNYILKPKIAFAYSLVLIIGIGTFIYFNQPETMEESGDCKTLACLERRELLNDHTIQNLDEDNLYDLVDVNELDEQLSTSTDSLSTNHVDSLPKNK